MIYLTDTNVLLGFSYRADPRYRIVRPTVRELLQMVINYRRHRKISRNFGTCQLDPLIETVLGKCHLKPTGYCSTLNGFSLCYQIHLMSTPNGDGLPSDYGVSGVQVHDARLVATMLVHDVTHILTFNTQDFIRYRPEGIIAIDPSKEIN